jgi:GNAT superfamily N-acetyltransferase
MGKSDDLVIRQAQPSDHSVLIEILYDTFECTWLPHIASAEARIFREDDRPARYVAERGSEFWVAERAHAVIGFVDWQGDFVNALHVRARYFRTGVGTRLMDKVEADIARAGYAAARLETDTFNTRSRTFYETRGYVEAARYPDLEWKSGLTTILFVKTLA